MWIREEIRLNITIHNKPSKGRIFELKDKRLFSFCQYLNKAIMNY